MKRVPKGLPSIPLFRFGAWICAVLFGAIALQAQRPKLVMLIAEAEYKSAQTLPAFAEKHLKGVFDVTVIEGSPGDGPVIFPGLEKLSTADVLLVSVRRRIPTQEDMARLKAYVAAGKPVVGIRTASHAFVLRKGTFPATHLDWPAWDAEIFGGAYSNHHGEGPVTEVTRSGGDHPILKGVRLPFTSQATLYRVAPLKPNATPILTGKIPGEPEQPIAYVSTHVGGGRAFYTSLGAPSDFEGEEFPRLLKNALIWAADTRPTR